MENEKQDPQAPEEEQQTPEETGLEQDSGPEEDSGAAQEADAEQESDAEQDDGIPGVLIEEGEEDAAAAAGDESEAAAKGPKEKRDLITGIFSTQSIQKVGTGTTVRRTVQKTFWMVEERKDGSVEIQPLNVNYIPSGPKRRITKDDLLQKFNPEPEFYIQTVYPAIRELNQTVVKGEEHRDKGELFSAEHEFSNALKVDVENVRANFGLGLTYLDRGQTKKADNIFERLVKLDAAFEQEHKHLFNEFGISLRKNKMYDQALTYYSRSLDLANADEHLYYNIARACFDKGDIPATIENLRTALKMNADLEAANQFMEWLSAKGYLKGEDATTAAAPKPEPEKKQAPASGGYSVDAPAASPPPKADSAGGAESAGGSDPSLFNVDGAAASPPLKPESSGGKEKPESPGSTDSGLYNMDEPAGKGKKNKNAGSSAKDGGNIVDGIDLDKGYNVD